MRTPSPRGSATAWLTLVTPGLLLGVPWGVIAAQNTLALEQARRARQPGGGPHRRADRRGHTSGKRVHHRSQRTDPDQLPRDPGRAQRARELPSGDVYDQVEVLAEDPRRDIAVLQVAGFELPWLELGNSDSLRIGSPVVLIGSPLGLENTASTGIVSGRRREPEGFQLLQISAPASRGSSGGAVLNGEGRVVGIAVSQMDGGQNLHFAVPVN